MHGFLNVKNLYVLPTAIFTHVKAMKIQRGMELWASLLTLTFGTMRMAQLSAVRGCTVPPGKFLGVHYMQS